MAKRKGKTQKETESAPEADDAGKRRAKNAILFFLLLFSYALLFLLSTVRDVGKTPIISALMPMHLWVAPTHYMMPLIGFMFIILGVNWAREFFETKVVDKYYFPVLFILVSLITFFCMLHLFYLPNVFGQDASVAVCIYDCDGFRTELSKQGTAHKTLVVEYWPEFRNSAFMLFIEAGVLGWIAMRMSKIVSQNFF